MALVGSFGPLIFMVSAHRALTYNNLNQTVQGRWNELEPINGSPLAEFLGPSLDNLTLTVVFSAELGLDPDAQFQLLRSLVRSGQHFFLILGGIPASENPYFIESIDSSSQQFDGRQGRVLWREVNLKLKEYH